MESAKDALAIMVKPPTARAPVNRMLPAELLNTTLEHLKDDKRALSRCMQACSALNKAAAPILYRAVNVEFLDPPAYMCKPDNQHPFNPFFSPPPGENAVTNTRGTTKEECLSWITHVNIWAHGLLQCKEVCATLHPVKSKLSVDTVRYIFTDNSFGPVCDYHFALPKNTCRFDEVLTAKQVVLYDNWPMSALSPIATNTTISVFKRYPIINRAKLDDTLWQWRRNQSSRAIYVFLPCPYYFAKGNIKRYGMPCGRKAWSHFADRLAEDAWESPATKEVLIVNIGTMESFYAHPRLDLASYLQKKVNQARPSVYEDEPPFTLQFQAMEDFLKVNDWKGIFEKKDVKQWIKDE